MRDRLTTVLVRARQQLAWSPTVTAMGVIGLALAGVCAVAAALRGAEIPPEGNLLETASFDGAVGFFLLTLVVLAASAHWTPRGRRRWVAWLAGLAAYSYTIETVQAFRGVDPRFSQVAGAPSQILGGVFFVVAVGVMVCFIVIAVKYFRAEPTPVVVGVRYGSLASLLAFGVGIWMSLVSQGRVQAPEGNLLYLHAAGFHGLQVIPLVALFLEWAGQREAVVRNRVHAAGLLWLGGCAAIAWQSGTGHAILQPTAASVSAGLLLVGSLGLMVTGLWTWMSATLMVPPSPSRSRT
jgi:hypothetical protein